MSITRKAFLVQLVQVGGGGWLLAGCGGGGGDDPPAPPPPPAGTCAATIAGNHGHALLIPTADLDSATAKTYDIQGAAAHTHSVSFSAAQLAQLKAGGTVNVTSSFTIDHDHAVGVRCA
jgi:hypothetical protein